MGLVKSASAVLLAAAALTVCAGDAFATRLSFSNASIEINAIEARYTGGFGTVTCLLRTVGVLHATSVVKTAGGLIGRITEARHAVAGCRMGEAEILRETLPWHLQYRTYTGTLPSITSVAIDVIGYTATIREPTFGITCSIRSSTTQPITLTMTRETRGGITGGRFRGTVTSSCGYAITLEAEIQTPAIPNTLTAITVLLI